MRRGAATRRFHQGPAGGHVVEGALGKVDHIEVMMAVQLHAKPVLGQVPDFFATQRSPHLSTGQYLKIESQGLGELPGISRALVQR